MSDTKVLKNLDNDTAWRLGVIAREAGNPAHTGVGDNIDRGLILRRMLEEDGFLLVKEKVWK